MRKALFALIATATLAPCQSVVQSDVETSIFQIGIRLTDQVFSSQGTAFCVSNDGLVITAFHVYAGAIKTVSDARSGELRIRRTNRDQTWFVTSAVEIVTIDTKHDLILFRIKEFDKVEEQWQRVGGIHALKVAGNASISLPHAARMVGYLGQDPTPIHLRSDIVGTTFVSIGPENVEEFLLSAELLPGHSGSPVIDDAGEVIGLVSSIVSTTLPFNPSQPMHAGLARAVKVEHLKRILEDIKSK